MASFLLCVGNIILQSGENCYPYLLNRQDVRAKNPPRNQTALQGEAS